jgi:hypothetical protein
MLTETEALEVLAVEPAPDILPQTGSSLVVLEQPDKEIVVVMAAMLVAAAEAVPEAAAAQVLQDQSEFTAAMAAQAAQDWHHQ